MSFEDVVIVDPYVDKGWTPEIKLTLASEEDVDDLESAFEVTFPRGYRDFVTTLGLGEYCNYIRVIMPNAIMSGCREAQEFLSQYWFWSLGEEMFPKERAVTSIQMATTIDGDVVLFHPSKPNELWVLPRNDDMPYQIGPDVYEAIDWLCTAHRNATGSVGEEHQKRYFVPSNPFAYDHGILRPEGF
ncbi:MAG TPA: SMI1/KNR4 family protein [Pyrinomonadaceae bacterium]|jgi:hypothetical protein